MTVSIRKRKDEWADVILAVKVLANHHWREKSQRDELLGLCQDIQDSLLGGPAALPKLIGAWTRVAKMYQDITGRSLAAGVGTPLKKKDS